MQPAGSVIFIPEAWNHAVVNLGDGTEGGFTLAAIRNAEIDVRALNDNMNQPQKKKKKKKKKKTGDITERLAAKAKAKAKQRNGGNVKDNDDTEVGPGDCRSRWHPKRVPDRPPPSVP